MLNDVESTPRGVGLGQCRVEIQGAADRGCRPRKGRRKLLITAVIGLHQVGVGESHPSQCERGVLLESTLEVPFCLLN